VFLMSSMSSRNQLGAYLNGKGLKGDALEVGVHRGEFAKALLDSWEGRLLHLVDPWDDAPGYRDQAEFLKGAAGGNGDRLRDLEKCRKTLLRWEGAGRVRYHVATSRVALGTVPDSSLDFVHLDGDHSYAAVLFDLRGWWRKLRPGGVLAGHDWLTPGAKTDDPDNWGAYVQDALDEFLRTDGCSMSREVHAELIVEEGGLPWTFVLEKP
jgi:SAM-dependent methyltransferase